MKTKVGHEGSKGPIIGPGSTPQGAAVEPIKQEEGGEFIKEGAPNVGSEEGGQAYPKKENGQAHK
jgi:hypothetical protein